MTNEIMAVRTEILKKALELAQQPVVGVETQGMPPPYTIVTGEKAREMTGDASLHGYWFTTGVRKTTGVAGHAKTIDECALNLAYAQWWDNGVRAARASDRQRARLRAAG